MGESGMCIFISCTIYLFLQCVLATVLVKSNVVLNPAYLIHESLSVIFKTMRTESECKPSERYLFAEEYLLDNVIKFWQEECQKRCKEKNSLYYKFVNWTRKENEIAIYTLYAYADFSIPKKFDCIFRFDNPNVNLIINYELTQCIYEAWFPTDSISDGHKHICVFRFENKIPEIIQTLHKGESKFSNVPKGQIKLGFCNSIDLSAIIENWKKVS
jgi:hypothetical protein